MGERVKNSHRAVLDPVLIARDDRACGLVVENILAFVVHLARMRVKTLDDLAALRRNLPEPDRRADNEEICIQNSFADARPCVGLEAMLGHVRIDARRNVVIDHAKGLHGHPGTSHDFPNHIHQRVGVAFLRAWRKRAIQEYGGQP